MRRTSDTISFRADSDLARLIDAAREPFGISRGDWVRGVILGHLHRGDTQHVDEQLSDLRRTLEELNAESRETRSALPRMLFAVLTMLGQVQVEDAKRVVQKVFSAIESNSAR
jgi:hypothetical protein